MLGHIEAAGYMENDKDVQIVSELIDDVRDAVTDYQVSGDPEVLYVRSFKQNWSRWEPNRLYMIRVSK